MYAKMSASTALAFLLFASTAHSEGTETLAESGNWQLSMNDFGDGTFSCETHSTNENGTRFSYETWPNGTSAMSVSDPDWVFDAESADSLFSISVDDLNRWKVNGQKYDSTITSSIDPGDSAAERLLDEIFTGKTLNIENAKNVMIAQFSLNGWPAMIEAHTECEYQIDGAG